MKINFLDFWSGFNPEHNFLYYLFKDIYKNVELAPISQCDYVIFSCFGENHNYVNRNKTKKIFYTGENLRPNFDQCDYSFTFDFAGYNRRNIRIPLYYFYIDWFNTGTWGNPQYLIHPSKINDNEFIHTPKTKFCATVFSSPKPIRYDLMNLLSRYKQVDGYGRPFGNHTEGELDKYEKLSQYKFSICPENSAHDGYYTEKLLHAKTAGTIPIYLADRGVDRDFNTKAFINVADYNNFEDLLKTVIEIDRDNELYNKIKNQTLFQSPISLDKIKENIRSILGD